MKNKQGFTLVEMLAVVIIIGILTSIALPQYRRAIQKAKATEALVMLRTINDSAERYAVMRGYRDFTTMMDTEKPGFKQMDMFDSITQSCTIPTGNPRALECESYTYYLDGYELKDNKKVYNHAYAVKNNDPYKETQFNLYRGDNPRLTCVGTQAACDLFNIEKGSSTNTQDDSIGSGKEKKSLNRQSVQR